MGRGLRQASIPRPHEEAFMGLQTALQKDVTAPLNILWVSFEDTSPRFGCYGDPLAQTPNVDRLAREGRLYRRAFSVAGVCSPSRSAIITGLYPTSVGTHHHRTAHVNEATPEMPTPYQVVLPHYVRCLPEYFRARGYFCSNNKKLDYQFAPPFTAWDECSRSAHWRNRHDPSQPFFSVFNLEPTHESGMWEENGTPRTDPDSVPLPPWVPDTRKCREALARQYDHIAENDLRLGELLSQLEEDGLSDSTAVFIWSDHGEGLPRAKRWLYDAGIHVPLLVRWPGHIVPGEICDDLVSLIDLGPTVLSLCGIDIPSHMHGIPFAGPARAKRNYIYATRDRLDEAYDMVRAIRDSRFKYIRNCSAETPSVPFYPYANRHPVMQELWRLHGQGRLKGAQELLFSTDRPVEELYDIDLDPFELNNLARAPGCQEHLARLRAALDEWMEDFDLFGNIDEGEMQRRWWPNGQQPATAAPIFVPITLENPGLKPIENKLHLSEPGLLQLHSATQGASIGWTTSEDAEPAWQLYTSPIRLRPGMVRIRAKAIRIGYSPSNERRLTLEID